MTWNKGGPSEPLSRFTFSDHDLGDASLDPCPTIPAADTVTEDASARSTPQRKYLVASLHRLQQNRSRLLPPPSCGLLDCHPALG